MQSVKTASLQDNINQVIEVIESNHLEQVILIGHSYGSFVITGVADKLCDKIQALLQILSVHRFDDMLHYPKSREL